MLPPLSMVWFAKLSCNMLLENCAALCVLIGIFYLFQERGFGPHFLQNYFLTVNEPNH